MKKNVPSIILAIACIVLPVAYDQSIRTVHQLQEEIAQLKTAAQMFGSENEGVEGK